MQLSYDSEPIVWSAHAHDYEIRRGFSTEEVEAAIRLGEWSMNDRGKLECRLDYAFDAIWNKKHYRTKQVRPVFALEEGVITIITVYTYFF